MIGFASPYILYLLLLLPLLAALCYASFLRRRSLERRYADIPRIKMLKPEASTKRRLWKEAFLLLSMIFLIIAIARPRIPKPTNENELGRGYELMIGLDISNSMYSTDVSPSRLDFAKRILNKLFDELHGNKVGLMVFAGSSFTQIPITTDLSVAKEMLQDVDPGMISNQGTAIDKVIEASSACFGDNELVGKAILLLTDGESQEGDAKVAAEKALKQGIRTFVIGIGSTQGGMIPMGDEVLKAEDGQPVLTRLNEEMCRTIAEAGDGIYLVGSNASSIARAVINRLDKLPKADIHMPSGASYYEIYAYPLALAFLCLLIEFFIQERKSRFFSRFKLFDR
ncbi:aerotolerance regulator BatB [Porphyromonas crevioricanis]|uniref:Aerotolerance regulator BatB n=2 Tax=Porphyromonas crevioricanis TaxID=393921 RepID=A0A0A2FJ85_9PORP|nr:VWA domain-containing protein [Porphyromonas crevioricanis]KGN90120.1 aerotolerance regulator BatB [Porphyromonas crevioricanis]KGN94875.1 aerotolerance regulator BatB [Porphyromonas crevioricanis]SJZ80640.1 Ca-activated chloride channel family protein [Porphyromonas crevioricanis]SQH72514.1 Mg-chelatase subunit ChlD [Porphyromonas crevioricanis]GAD04973.1 batB [Porphyromonas crevioricanis JCM 15906]